MAADHDQVAVLLFGQVMDFLARLAVGEVAVFLFQVRVLENQTVQALFGLVKLLLLQLGKVHGYVATKGHGHGLDDMHE